jgi:hypothetical protein
MDGPEVGVPARSNAIAKLCELSFDMLNYGVGVAKI